MKYHSRTIKTALKIDFKYHYLRHTYGTRLAELNTPTHILCNQMGHASGKVTERYYLAVSQSGIDILVRHAAAVDGYFIYTKEKRDAQGFPLILGLLEIKHATFIYLIFANRIRTL